LYSATPSVAPGPTDERQQLNEIVFKHLMKIGRDSLRRFCRRLLR